MKKQQTFLGGVMAIALSAGWAAAQQSPFGTDADADYAAELWAIMEEMKRIEQEVKSTADTARNTLNEGVAAADTPVPSIDPGTHADIADTIAAQDDMTTAADTRSHADAADDAADEASETEASEPREASTSSDSVAAETPPEGEENRAETPDPSPRTNPKVPP